MTPRRARLVCFNICCLALLGTASIFGWPQHLYAADVTKLTLAVAGLVLIASFVGPHWRRWLCDQGVPLLLGLMGTMIGFWIALEGAISGGQEMKLEGLGTALSTTICGLVAHFYLILSTRIGDE